MLQTWSMAVDMHQFLLGTLLLVWVRGGGGGAGAGRQGAVLVLAAALFAALLPPFLATLAEGWPPLMVWSSRALQNPTAEPMFYAMYVPTHMRAGSYVVGLLAGLGLRRLKVRGRKTFASDGIRTCDGWL